MSEGNRLMNNIKWGPNGREVYERTYRRIKQNGEPENWLETVTRVVDGNLELVEEKHREPNEREKLIDLFYNFKALPAGRHLWMSGVPGRQFLFNPVVGTSQVTTREGLRKISELEGQTIDVLSMSDQCDVSTRTWRSVGTWRPASFIYSGKQDTYRVLFESGREVVSTAEHVWYAVDSRKKLTTLELEGHRIPVMTTPRPLEDGDYWSGVMHGIIFGDGSLSSGDDRKSYIRIHADEKMELLSIFERFGHRVSVHSDGVGYVGRLPGNWKQLPSNEKSASYWRGFFVGWFAADGNVDKRGRAQLHNKDVHTFESATDGLEKAGLSFGGPILVSDINPFNGEPRTLYRMTIQRLSLTENDFLQEEKRNRFLSVAISKRLITDVVVSVEATGETEDVYCCLEDTTKSWTVNGVLTGNCHHAGWDEENVTTHFAFNFDQLMQGGGVGANYSNRYVNLYGPIKHAVDVHIVCDPDHPDYYELKSMNLLSEEYSYEWDGATRVPDSREGWSESLATLLGAFWNGVDVLVLDVSLVRHKGAKIKTFGGTAAGPMPLAKLLVQTASLLSDRVGQNMSSLDAMLIDHWIGECVVSGNVRRSARMSIKNWADHDIFDFINCKQNSNEHWSTNISIEIDDDFFKALKADDAHAKAVYRAAMVGMLTNGEPGFYNRSLAQVGEVGEVSSTNPCGEIALEEFENCNLGHVNLDAFYDDFEGAVEAHRLMTRYLIRATFGDVPNPKQQEVLERNRRIGVGHFGFQGWLVKKGIRYSDSHRSPMVRKTLRDFYNAVRKEARRYAFHLRVPEPIKVTTVAPTGTISKLAGRTEGIHPVLFKYYINRVRYSTVDPGQVLMLEQFEKEGYDIEDDLYSMNTKVVSFIAKNNLLDEVAALGLDADYLIESASDISLADMLAVQAMYQEYYADNAVSFTVNVAPHPHQLAHMEKQIADGVSVWDITMIPPPDDAVDAALGTLIHYLPALKGTTLMVDGSRPQSPYEALTKEQYEMYQLVSVGDGIDENCSTGACPIK